MYSLITPNEKSVMPDNNTRKAMNVVNVLGVPTNSLKYIKYTNKIIPRNDNMTPSTLII